MDETSALLEREEQLTEQHAALAWARSGRGELAVFAAAADAGKTSLISEFVRRAAGRRSCCVVRAIRCRGGVRCGPPIDVIRDANPAMAQRLVEGASANGRTDREIADQLVISTKTVGHHVSHLPAKLDVRSRWAAAVVAERLGLAGTP